MRHEPGISNISVFGSHGRGNPDAYSDLDVLVLCKDDVGTQSEESVRALVSERYHQEPSISWYGEEKMKRFHASGDLFAWHLYRESFPLPGFISLAEIYGEPAPYMNCLDDIAGLHEIFETIPGQIRQRPQNLVYELGLAYVCMRNIAMSASSTLNERVDFGRLSPYGLPGLAPSIQRDDYDTLCQCRHASTRGTHAPDVTMDVENLLKRGIEWAVTVEREL